ncbi:MAG: ComE operon protein 3 [Flavobacterium sp. SCGC AAA160-P02]|nr:MAG: ComE operon protein 3 [Flavobacterium sp. SCGC AAA160-P02]
MKKLLGYLPFHFLLFLIIGICCQFYTDYWSFGVEAFLCIFFSLCIIGFFLRKTMFFIVITWLTFFLVGMMVVYQGDATKNKNYYKNYLTDSPIAILEIQKVLKPGINHHKYIAKVIQVNGKNTLGNILLNIKKDSLYSMYRTDDQLVLKSHFITIKSSLNPHQFDYKGYQAKQGIYQQVFITNQQLLYLQSSSNRLLRIIDDIRTKIQKSLQNQDFSKDELAVINALLLGQRQDISKELIEDYSKAGAIHILAVSGLHVGIILLILSFVLQPLERFKRGKVVKLSMMIIFLWFFALLAGMSASVVRAVTMFSAIAFGQFINKSNAIEQSLIFSMFLLLICKPMFLFDVGFQLSYLAVFGIIWIQPVVYNIWNPRIYIVDKAWQIISVSVAAQFGILPLSLYYFHQFPGLFLISNLVILPFMGAILGLGIIVLILSYGSLLPEFLVGFYSGVISVLNYVVTLIASQEKFLLTEISFSGLKLMSTYLITIVGFRFFVKRNGHRLLIFLCSILIFQGVLMYEKYTREVNDEFVVFHKSRNSIVGKRIGERFEVYHDMDSLSRTAQNILTNYKIGENIQYKIHQKIPTVFYVKKQPILIINKVGIYDIQGLQKPIIILQQSPKINLDRLIDKLEPSMIIADGSNYKSFIKLWEDSSVRNKIPFWSTYKKGALRI